MEARRLAILSSHLCPSRSGSVPARFSTVSASACASDRQSESVLDSNKEAFRDDCVFCQIVRDESPALKLYEDDMCLCILDTKPLSRGHSLIIPKSHFSSLDTTPPSEHLGGSCDVFESAFYCQCNHESYWLCSISIQKRTVTGTTLFEKVLIPYSFNLLVNNGAAAGQVIFHTHIHIIPRKACDCLWTSESLHRRPLKLDQETSGLANRVRELLLNNSEESKDQVSSLS